MERPFLALLILLSTRISNAQDGQVDIAGAHIHYSVQGEGHPLVLIHGWTLDSRMWEGQVPALASRYRVIRVDRRGFGRSGGKPDETRDPADLSALLDHLGVESAYVLGMSQGGRVAMSFALAHPEKVDALILHGSVPPMDFNLPWSGPDALPLAAYDSLARNVGLDAFRQAWSAHELLEIPESNPEVKSRLVQMLSAYQGGNFIDPVEPSFDSKPATMADIGGIAVPTLILIGDREVPYLKVVAHALSYGIPHARLVEVRGGGHMINMVEPERYNQAILDFLRAVGR